MTTEVSRNNFRPFELERPLRLTESQARFKEISKWLATGLIFAMALTVGGLGAVFGLSAGGVLGLCVVSALISGFAFSTAMVVREKAMQLIDQYFDSVAV